MDLVVLDVKLGWNFNALFYIFCYKSSICFLNYEHYSANSSDYKNILLNVIKLLNECNPIQAYFNTRHIYIPEYKWLEY